MPLFTIQRCLPRRLRPAFLFKLVAIYSIVFICALPILQGNVRYSKLYRYNEGNSFQNAYNTNSQRLEQAENFLKTINGNTTREMYLKSKPSLRYVIGVVTVFRGNPKLQYLTQVISRLHQVLSRDGRTDEVMLFICNVDSHKHEEAERMSSFFPNITRIYSSQIGLDAHLRRTIHSSETQDYAFCLESALQFNSKYVLLLEDDAYPHEHFYQILESVMRNKFETQIRKGELVKGSDDWAWLKLNKHYYLNAFHDTPFTICQWVALSTLVAGSVALIFYIYQEYQNRNYSLPRINGQNKKYIMSAYIVFLISFIFFFITFEIIGRAYYLKLQGISEYFYSLEPGIACCMPAVLYPYEKIPGIVDALRHEATTKRFKRIPKDLFLDEYRKQHQLKQYLLAPNIFTHIGFYSSLDAGYKPKRAFVYEYFND